MKVTNQSVWTIAPEFSVYDNRREAVAAGVIEDAAYSNPDIANEGDDYDLFLVRTAVTTELPHPLNAGIRFEHLLLAYVKSRPCWEYITEIRFYTKVGAGWSIVAKSADHFPDDEILVELTDLLLWLWIRSAPR